MHEVNTLIHSRRTLDESTGKQWPHIHQAVQSQREFLRYQQAQILIIMLNNLWKRGERTTIVTEILIKNDYDFRPLIEWIL